MLNVLYVVIGILLLVKGADCFVDGSSSVALHFKISTLIIGLTIVSFGTGLPELAVSFQSMYEGAGDLTLGNVIGSNIANILLILGVCAVIHPITVEKTTVRREMPLLLVATTVLFIIASKHYLVPTLNPDLTRVDGAILILFFIVFIYFLYLMLKDSRDSIFKKKSIQEYSMGASIVYVIVGVLGIIVGSNFVVEGATRIARTFNISERIIGLTIIALGTCLPELVTSINAVKKGNYGLVIGNIVGSNIFNIAGVLGLSLAIFGSIVGFHITVLDLVTFVISSVLLYYFSLNNYKLDRTEGYMFIFLFILYYSFVLFG